MANLTLDIPLDIEQTARELASATARPVETVLMDRLKTAFGLPLLPPDEEAELAALHHLSDDTLWTIAREQLPSDVRARMEVLMGKMSRGTITPDEREEEAGYVDRAERLMVRKGEAGAILTRRGYRVSPKDMMPLE